MSQHTYMTRKCNCSDPINQKYYLLPQKNKNKLLKIDSVWTCKVPQNYLKSPRTFWMTSLAILDDIIGHFRWHHWPFWMTSLAILDDINGYTKVLQNHWKTVKSKMMILISKCKLTSQIPYFEKLISTYQHIFQSTNGTSCPNAEK